MHDGGAQWSCRSQWSQAACCDHSMDTVSQGILSQTVSHVILCQIKGIIHRSRLLQLTLAVTTVLSRPQSPTTASRDAAAPTTTTAAAAAAETTSGDDDSNRRKDDCC